MSRSVSYAYKPKNTAVLPAATIGTNISRSPAGARRVRFASGDGSWRRRGCGASAAFKARRRRREIASAAASRDRVRGVARSRPRHRAIASAASRDREGSTATRISARQRALRAASAIREERLGRLAPVNGRRCRWRPRRGRRRRRGRRLRRFGGRRFDGWRIRFRAIFRHTQPIAARDDATLPRHQSAHWPRRTCSPEELWALESRSGRERS